MKKCLIFLTVLCMMQYIGTALASGPASPTLLDYSDALGYPTHYLLYDREYYDAECDQPGTIVQLKYMSHVYGDKDYKHSVKVYLPYGYDYNGSERYPIVYFLHGNRGNQDVLLGNTLAKNALDNMIKDGIAQPFILVAPSYYYDLRNQLADVDLFAAELRTEIMPLVESTYRTYAESADEAGFVASRSMRAISGYSRGSMYTWYYIDQMADYSSIFLPFAAPAEDLEKLTRFMDSESTYAHDFFIYYCMGGVEDTTTYDVCLDFAQKLANDKHFSIGLNRSVNNVFVCASDNIHQDKVSRFFFYNAFVDGLFQ